jgi:integrase
MAIKHVKVNGRWCWQARVQVRGRRRSQLCATRDAAKSAAADLLKALETEHAEAQAIAARPATLKQALEAYAQDLLARGKDEETVVKRVEYTARVIRRLQPALLERPVSLIGDAEIFAFRAARQREGTKGSTVNRDFRTLRAALKYARPEYRFPAGVFYPEDAERVRYLRDEEELLVFSLLGEPFRTMARLAALTLVRQGALRLLRREQVRLWEGVFELRGPRAKGGARSVILNSEAQELLRRQLASHEGVWVFPNKRTGQPYSRVHVTRTFRRAAQVAGLEDFHFHDLRHHGATKAANQGATDRVLMALGGWSTPRMVRRYSTITDATLRAAAERLSAPWTGGTPNVPAAPADAARPAGRGNGPRQRPRKSPENQAGA